MDLALENKILKEKLWASRSNKQHESNYFILINSNVRPDDYSEENYVRGVLDDFMDEFKNSVCKFVEFNNTKKRQHHWSSKFIDKVCVRYVIERGNGKLKKDGTPGRVGGALHLHITLRIKHHSNISVPQEAIAAFATEYLSYHLGKKPFVGKPRLITADKTEEYMLKSEEFEGGCEWTLCQ